MGLAAVARHAAHNIHVSRPRGSCGNRRTAVRRWHAGNIVLLAAPRAFPHHFFLNGALWPSRLRCRRFRVEICLMSFVQESRDRGRHRLSSHPFSHGISSPSRYTVGRECIGRRRCDRALVVKAPACGFFCCFVFVSLNPHWVGRVARLVSGARAGVKEAPPPGIGHC